MEHFFQNEFDSLYSGTLNDDMFLRPVDIKDAKPTTEDKLMDIIKTTNESLVKLSMSTASEINNSQIDEATDVSQQQPDSTPVNSVSSDLPDVTATTTSSTDEVSTNDIEEKEETVHEEEQDVNLDYSTESFEITNKTIDLFNRIEKYFKYSISSEDLVFRNMIKQIKCWQQTLNFFKKYDELLQFILFYMKNYDEYYHNKLESEEVLFIHTLYTMPSPWLYVNDINIYYGSLVLRNFFNDLKDYINLVNK